MIYRSVALAALCGCIAAAGPRVPVLVELFTSEGCSSCPPADLLLQELTQRMGSDIEIIPLSEHVDYWDHLGWRDPFSSYVFSARQQAYGDVFKTESVYTPQMIVDGIAGFNGSDSEQARRNIRLASQQPKADVSIERKDDSGRVTVRVDHLGAAKVEKADVFLAVTESQLASSVAHGENAGRTLRHTGVVRTLMKVVEIDAKRGAYIADLQVQLGKDWKRDQVRAIIFVQDRKTRRIVGAASSTL